MRNTLDLDPSTSDSGDLLFAASDSPKKRRAAALLQACIKKAHNDGVFSEPIDLTPELAELLLLRNKCNRNPKPAVIADISRDIEHGRWDFNGETLIVSGDGFLNDGQNRCHAVIKAGRAVRTFVAFGLKRESRRSVDSTQSTRTPGDFVTMEGIHDGNNVAAVAGYLWQIDRFGEIPLASHQRAYRPTKQEVNDYVARHIEAISEALKATPHHGAARVASFSLLAVCFRLIGKYDPEAAGAYLKHVVHGADPATQSAIHVTRERLMEEKRKRALWPHKTTEILLRGWGHHRKGEKIKKIVLTGSWPKIAR